MMTDDELKNIIKYTYEDFEAEEYHELIENYFKADKTDWYEEENGRKIWDKEKVKQFWKLIRTQVMPQCREPHHKYDFAKFIFPEFEVLHLVKYYASYK